MQWNHVLCFAACACFSTHTHTYHIRCELILLLSCFLFDIRCDWSIVLVGALGSQLITKSEKKQKWLTRVYGYHATHLLESNMKILQNIVWFVEGAKYGYYRSISVNFYCLLILWRWHGRLKQTKVCIYSVAINAFVFIRNR